MIKTGYLLKNPEIMNQNLLQVNRLKPRATIIPALKEGVYYKNKEKSELLFSLNGDYKFKYEKSDCISDFYKTDLCDNSWDIIDVPSMWQYRGYGTSAYTNIYYPIPFDPPFVSCENPVGYYRKSFNIDNLPEKSILHFGGVDSAFYVYLNGEYIGFSKGSRNVSEFDITKILKKGENILAVKVFTFSDGTYLENQDMLIGSGIFRDVYLINTSNYSLWDYRVTSDLSGFNIDFSLLFDENSNDDLKMVVSINDEEKTFKAEKNINTYFKINEPKLWNAEEPNLYKLKITLIKNGEIVEIHSKKIGMMHTKIEGPKFLVNGKPIYMKGVNRHEYDPKNGRAITVELIEEELQKIKDCNANAVRTSHYTNNPAFYEICSEIGLYVMDEADLETHGASATGDQGFLSKDPTWKNAYLDRMERSLNQNKNEACVFMHSVGNECGIGENMIDCLKMCYDFDPNKVSIHDQAVEEDKLFGRKPNDEYDAILRVGYRSMDDVKEMCKHQPIFMQVEYAHAMGNSPGSIMDYWTYVYNSENNIGGFIWEFKNHGFYDEDENKKPYYKYGGDFGTVYDHAYNWYNFCLDGFMKSDGTPKHSWFELMHAHSPIFATFDKKVKIKNTFDFTNLKGTKVIWQICEDYTVLKTGALALNDLHPHEETFLDIDTSIENPVCGAKYYLNLTFAFNDTIINVSQFDLGISVSGKKYKPEKINAEISCENNIITVKNNNFEVSFKNGTIIYYEKDNKKLINSPIEFNFTRAYTDNDGILGMTPLFYKNAGIWNDNGIESMKYQAKEMNAEKKEDRIVITSKGKALPVSSFYGFETEIIYEIFENGLILTDIKGKPYGKIPDRLPRIGLIFELDKKFDRVKWYGRGIRENYGDCKSATPVGIYDAKIEDTYTIYDMPQETGNHEDVGFVIPYSNEESIIFSACGEFAFSYHDFSLETLQKAKHINEIEKSDKNYLYLDYKNRPLGSHACGPEPEEEYELRPHSFEFAFAILGNETKEKALELSRTDFAYKTKRLSGNIVNGVIEEERVLL